MVVVLLDLDKTLVNVEDYVDYCAALAELKRLVQPTPAADTPETYWGKCTKEAMDLLVAHSQSPLWPLLNEVVERYELEGAERSRPMPGLEVFLAALEGRRRAIVTLLGPRATERVLQLHGISVDAVVARERGLRPKPFPDPVLEALRRLGASPRDAVFVGDSEWDEAAAEGAGVRFLGVTNGRENAKFKTGLVARDLLEAAALLKKLEA